MVDTKYLFIYLFTKNIDTLKQFLPLYLFTSFIFLEYYIFLLYYLDFIYLVIFIYFFLHELSHVKNV